jgi:hypothetical protein
VPTREHVTKRQLLRRLPETGAPGWTSHATPGTMPAFDAARIPADAAAEIAEIAAESDTGSVLFVRDSDITLIVPPFPVEETDAYSEVYTRTLVDLVSRPHTVGVFLLRLGGFSTGVFRDGFLIDSKTGARFVKNRHRKGGQSQRRYDRIREKQVHLLFEKACQEAREKLEPLEEEIEYMLLGGDRLTLLAFRKECDYFERFGPRLMRRVLQVPGDPRKATLEAMPTEVWSSEVYVWDVPATED